MMFIKWISSSCIWSCSKEDRKKTSVDFKVYEIRLVVCACIELLILQRKDGRFQHRCYDGSDIL